MRRARQARIAGSSANVAIVGSKEKDPRHGDWYVLDLEKANLLSFAVPSGDDLATLSADVDANNGFGRPPSNPTMDALRGKIKHVIYIQKENRTYDQVLGDLRQGNGDPRLVEFPQPVTPNFHDLATRFVDLDNWYMASDVSGDGWNWAEQGHANDYTNKSVPVSYAGGGFDFEWNGTVRETERRPTGLRGPSVVHRRAHDGARRSDRQLEHRTRRQGHRRDRGCRRRPPRPDRRLHLGLRDPRGPVVSPLRPVCRPDVLLDAGRPVHDPDRALRIQTGAVQAPPLRPAINPYFDRYYRGWDLNTPDDIASRNGSTSSTAT